MPAQVAQELVGTEATSAVPKGPEKYRQGLGDRELYDAQNNYHKPTQLGMLQRLV